MKAFFILALFSSLAVHGEVFRGPISSALGGSGRAAMDGTEGAFLNPALAPLVKGFDFDAYLRDGELDPGQHSHAWGFGAGDNTPNVLFPAVLSYIKSRDTGVASGPVDGELYHLAVGKTFGDFAFGVSGSRLSSIVIGDSTYVQWNYSLGMLWLINPNMGLAYVLNNIANSGSDVPIGIKEVMQQGAGFFASMDEVARLRLDITRNESENPEQKMVYMAGFESLTSRFMVFRVGYRLDDQENQQYVTAGMALAGPRLKLDYSFEKNLKGTGEALHSVDLRMPF